MARAQRVACLLAPDFEDSEFRIPYDRLIGEGYQVDVIAAKQGDRLEGKKGKEEVRADRGIDDVKPDDYDALFIPGGYSPDKLRADARFVDFTRRFDTLGRPIVTVCHGPQLLLTAGLVRPGRKLTAWKTVQGDLAHTGAEVVDEPVVRDGNWVTSRQPSDLEAFSDAAIELLSAARTEELAPAPGAW
jgi:protease I